MTLKTTIVDINNPEVSEISELLEKIRKYHVPVNYENEENKYEIEFEKFNPRFHEFEKKSIDNLIHFNMTAGREIIINSPLTAKLSENYFESYNILPEYLPDVFEYIKNQEIDEIIINIYDKYPQYMEDKRIEERRNIWIKYRNEINDKLINGELSVFVISALIIKFFKGEDLEKPTLNIHLSNLYPGFAKYLNHTITSEELFNSRCFNAKFDDKGIHLNKTKNSVSFLKENEVLESSNVSRYMIRPEIRFLGCFHKLLHRLNDLKK